MSLARLAAKIAAVPVNGRGHRRYPGVLKCEIMAALASSGLSHKDFAEQVGVPGANLCHWRELAPSGIEKAPAPVFKRLVVESAPSSQMLTVRVPGGIVLEGLSISAAAELLQALTKETSC